MEPPSPAPGGASVAVSRADAAITYTLGLAALWLSYSVLEDLALEAGLTAGQARVWPLCVDGLILVATRAAVTFGNHPARRYAWGLLWASAAVSVAGNAIHAVMPPGAPPLAVVVAVGVVPPISALAVTHLAVVRARVRAADASSASPPAPDNDDDAPDAADEHTPPTHPDAPDDVQVTHPTHHDDAPDASDLDALKRRAAQLAAEGHSNYKIGEMIGKSEPTVRRYLANRVTL